MNAQTHIRGRSALVCLFMIFGTIYLQAQHVLTLDECIAIARRNSLTLRISTATARSAHFAQEELKTTSLPHLNFGAGAIYAPSSSSFGYDPALSNGGQLAGQVILQQPLYDAGVRQLKSSQLDLELTRLSHEYSAADRDIIFSVKEAYIELLFSQEATALLQSSAEQISEYLDLVNQLYRGGSGSYTDVLKTGVQLALAHIAVEHARESQNMAKLSLAHAMGIPADTALTAAGSLEYLSNTTADTLGTDASDSSFTNLDLQMAQLEIEKGRVEIKLAQSEILPSMNLNADAGLLTSFDNLHLPLSERSSMIGASIGLSIEFPLLTWGANDLRIEQRKLAVDIQLDQQELLRRSILTERQKMILQLHTAWSRLDILKQNVQAAEENFSLTKSKYASGGSLALEVLSAQQLLVDTRTTFLQTASDIRLLLARLEQISAHQ